MFYPGTLHSRLPQGIHGSAKIVHDSPDKLTRLRAAISGQPLRADKYTRLFVNGQLYMTDAEFEWMTNRPIIVKMRGDVLLGGLGLGFIVPAIANAAMVTSVTILEKSADVIALVGKHYKHPKVKIIEADVWTWPVPKKAFDIVYIDIWKDVPNEDNRDEIHDLKARFKPSLKKSGRTFVWCEHLVRG